MASLMEELMETLDAEEKLYRELIPVEQEKTRAIAGTDLEAMRRIVEKEHELVDKTQHLENVRKRIVLDIATVLGKDPDKMTLASLADTLKKQPEDQRKLQMVHDRLRKTVMQLQDINQSNENLLREAMEMVEFNMNVIRSTRMSSGSSNYASDASEVYGTAPQQGMFDAKQ